MTDFKNPKGTSGSRQKWATMFRSQTAQRLAAAILLMGSSTALDAKTIYVDGNKATSGNGKAWNTSFRYLRDALDVSVSGDDIYITKGTYYPDDSTIDPAAKGDRERSFRLIGVKLYGGFAGTEADPTARAQNQNPNILFPVAGGLTEPARTILSGEILKPIFPSTVARVPEFSLHVIKMDANSTLDGLTVEAGNANGRRINEGDNRGGGCLTKEGTTLTLNKVEFRNNRSVDSGGGIWGNVVAVDCRFTGNLVSPDPFYNYLASGGAIKGVVVARDCTFKQNSVTSQTLDDGVARDLGFGKDTIAEGGAIAGETTATNCEFESNSATSNAPVSAPLVKSAIARGGALFGIIKASKCRFITNEVIGDGEKHTSYGGAIAGRLTVESCAFEANATSLCFPDKQIDENIVPPDLVEGGGGALATFEIPTSPVSPAGLISRVNNSVFTENSSKLRGGAIQCTRRTQISIQNSTFIENGVAGTNPKGSAVSCGGKVIFLNNIFAYKSKDSAGTRPASTIPAGSYSREKFIVVLGLGAIRTSGTEYPTEETVSKNLLSIVSLANPYPPIVFPKADLSDLAPFAPSIIVDLSGDAPPGAIKNGFTAGNAKFEGVKTAADFGTFPTNLQGADGKWGTIDDRASLQRGSAAENKGQFRFMALDTLDIDGDGDLEEVTPADLAGFTRIQPPAGVSSQPDLGAYEIGDSVHAPEIQITRLETPAQLPLVDNSTTPLDFTAFPEVAKTFEIKNLGPANLNGLKVTIAGPGASDYVITQPAQSTVLPLNVTSFQIKFSPGQFGVRAATISVFSDDTDENPFEIRVTGSSLQPEIDIEEPVGNSVVSGNSVNFGAVGDFGSAQKVFTIKNPGTKILALQGVSVEGVDAKDFIVSALGTTSVGFNGGSTTFTVTFRPGAGGAKNATLVIVSDDGNENPFRINVQGSAPLPEIVVEQAGGIDVVDGTSTIDFGKTGYLATTVKVFTIRNIGLGHLTIPSIVSSGLNAGDFVVSAPASSVVLPGGSTTFTLRYRPSVSGTRTGLITIVNDDPDDENPFTIAVTGNSLLSPKIAVRQPFLPDIADGDSNSFGSVKKGLLYTKKFTIRNDGNGVLKGISVKITGAKSFTHTIPSATVLSTGQSVSFKVTFKPTTAGVMNANLQIISNDLEFGVFDVALSGKGVVKKRKKSKASAAIAWATAGAGKGGKVSISSSSDGPKYMMLTLPRTENSVAAPSDVEVSANLVDWFSGENFTKTLKDTESVLEVRDGVPITAGEKRYIRLKPKAD